MFFLHAAGILHCQLIWFFVSACRAALSIWGLLSCTARLPGNETTVLGMGISARHLAAISYLPCWVTQCINSCATKTLDWKMALFG
ncbi:hypothetical protein GGS24DRAFT_469501 [Hypoxylon argillaceum]|nr:hypothetical protein GGS24DRAFT_469501 [Hypoxylon argillaceum]